ncbi:hypothetical protein ASE94_14535 [Devosia sp. Leaf64]|jgi:hypothetical protein|nr:hypothetical protein ASE94_14535 [Devosia sp. Leaf64]
MRFCLVFFLFVFSALSARAETAQTAFSEAIDLFEAALPNLPAELVGVDIATYRDALTLRQFRSAYWGGSISLGVAEAGEGAERSCKDFAAFVRLPPQDGKLVLTLCPQFSTPGADALRRLTIIHEMVHVVAGPDECRAMAFAARVEEAATGTFTPVDRYWAANNCAASAFSLPR